MPREFTSIRPAVTFEHVSFDMKKAEHPEASRIPSSNSAPLEKPALLGNPEDWSELCCGSDPPKTSADYVRSDRSVTGLRVVTFQDATIVDVH